jgi:hypothetical protein
MRGFQTTIITLCGAVPQNRSPVSAATFNRFKDCICSFGDGFAVPERLETRPTWNQAFGTTV